MGEEVNLDLEHTRGEVRNSHRAFVLTKEGPTWASRRHSRQTSPTAWVMA